MLDPLPTSPRRIYFSRLQGVEFGSPECIYVLEQFLTKTKERKELGKLQGSHAIHVADILEKVRDFATISGEVRVEAFSSSSGHSEMSHAYLSSPAVTLRNVGSITNLLYI
jgi:hypothetical protein